MVSDRSCILLTTLTKADHPPEKARRTLTLVAKSLIVLANVTKFGQKEAWMEPMNKFVLAATPEFKVFIDAICSYSTSQGSLHEPQYQAAQQVKQRLPPLSREGLSSLPFLLDGPRSYATLVDLWTDSAPSNITETPVEECIKAFHKICCSIKQKTQDCITTAEVAQEPNTKLEGQWQKMLTEQPRNHIAHNPFDQMYAENDITALPQPKVDRKNIPRSVMSGVAEDEAESPCETASRTITSSTNSSSASFEVFDDYRSRQIRSRDGQARGRYLQISNHRRGRIE